MFVIACITVTDSPIVFRRAADARGMKKYTSRLFFFSIERANGAASVTFMMWLFVLMLSSDKSGERGTTSMERFMSESFDQSTRVRADEAVGAGDQYR